MIYKVEWSKEAKRHVQKYIDINQTKLLKKLYSLVGEIALNPRKGLGHPEPLKMGKGLWSRRIDHEHRLVYKINDEEKIIKIVSAMKHYGDK